ncbi:MAG: hypothetical protein AVDCRST_MAG12-1478, partial [uncultured Rubrobacteraceae bacterium]
AQSTYPARGGSPGRRRPSPGGRSAGRRDRKAPSARSLRPVRQFFRTGRITVVAVEDLGRLARV